MSWSLYVQDVDTQAVADAVNAKLQEVYPDPAEEVTDQVDFAVAHVVELLNSGAIGKAAKVNLSLNGHANPGHVQTEGWGNDMVGINVSVAEYAPEEAGA
jgi:hypothetical protein